MSEERVTIEDAEGAEQTEDTELSPSTGLRAGFDMPPAAATHDVVSGPGKKKRKSPDEMPKELIFEDGTAVAAYGLGIHQIKDGKRHWVPDTWTQTMLGIRMDEVVFLFPEQLLAIPEGMPIPTKAPAEPLF